MKCLRCGRCCFYAVVVIHPNAVKEDLDLRVGKLPDDSFLFLDGSRKCPHLTWVGDDAQCAIHEYDWFKDTPCGTHTQIELNDDEPCCLGVFMRAHPDVWKAATKQV